MTPASAGKISLLLSLHTRMAVLSVQVVGIVIAEMMSYTSAVMLSPRGQNFGLGLGLKALASASRFWPQPGLDLVVLLCNRAFFVQKLCKIL